MIAVHSTTGFSRFNTLSARTLLVSNDGGRDCYVGIEYGLIGMQVGGRRTVAVPPNLTYHERKTYKDLPEDAMLVYELTLVEFRDKWDPEMETRLLKSNDDSTDCHWQKRSGSVQLIYPADLLRYCWDRLLFVNRLKLVLAQRNWNT